MTSPTEIQRAVAAYFKLKVGEVVYPATRSQETVMARHVAWWFERKVGRSFPAIGRLYGRVDHSTVVAATNHMRERLAAGDARYTKAIADLERELSFDATDVGPTLAEQVAALKVEVAELKKTVAELQARLPFVLAPSPCGDTLKHLDLVALKGGKP